MLQGIQKVSSALQGLYQIRSHGVHKFKAKIEVYGEIGPFEYYTAADPLILQQALALRYEVFHHEMIGKKNPIGIDVDEYDSDCDHLVIVEKKSQKVVGTYRLNCSLFSQNFYSEREFNIQNIMALPGIKLELGRACIHKDYRKGVVISLLWKGIADYMAASGAQYLFGCASIKINNPRQAALLYHHFEQQGRFAPQYLAPPTIKYSMPGLDLWIKSHQGELSLQQKQEADELIPPLCRAYLKIGAYLGGEPAYDEEFKCIDFLTILHREDLNRTLWKRYKLDSVES